MRLNKEQKEILITMIKAFGTIKAAANAVGLPMSQVRAERSKSAIFDREVRKALAEGIQDIGDDAVINIRKLASGENKDVRSRLTANMALANWAVPGFRGVQKTEGTVQHNVRVITGTPRPKYEELDNPEKEKYIEDKQKLKELNSGEVIEGEIVE